MAEHNKYGKLGEELAVNWLIKNGFKILDRNWRCGRFEIDVVCLKDSMIIVVEIKSRHSGVERVDELLSLQKRRHIVSAGNAWLKKHNMDNELRFDLIVVDSMGDDIHHYPEAILVYDV